jgi:hypothetical protein
LQLERSVFHLQQLYTVVVSLALTVAITNLVDQAAAVPIRMAALPYFVSYLVTLVPFYHGALRHLDVTYLKDPAPQPRSGALMVDWSLLFIESCGLLTLALLISRPEAFSYTFIGLLAFDAIWAFAAYLEFSPDAREQRSEHKWAIINFVAVVVLIIAMVALHAVDPRRPVGTYRWVLVTTVASARTIWDYCWCWSYYYPVEGKK